MTWQSILAALETGKMTGVGNAMTAAERETIAKTMGKAESQTIPASAKCSSSPRAPAIANSNGPDWNGWSDPANTRFPTGRRAGRPGGVKSETNPKLKLKWAFGFPGVTTAFGTPTVMGATLFVGAANGSVYSIDTKTGCMYWAYEAAAGVRVAPVVSNDGGSLYF